MPCIIPFICCSESLAQTWSICNAELLRRGWWLQKGVAYTCWRDHCGYRNWLSALHRPKISSGNFGGAKRTSGYFRSVVFSKYPGVTCTWVEQELEGMALFLQILNETVNSPGGGASFPDFCAQEHHEIGWITGTSLLPSQAVLGRPMAARSRCGFPKCCWNRDLSKASLLFSWMTWQSGFSVQWQQRG